MCDSTAIFLEAYEPSTSSPRSRAPCRLHYITLRRRRDPRDVVRTRDDDPTRLSCGKKTTSNVSSRGSGARLWMRSIFSNFFFAFASDDATMLVMFAMMKP